MWTVTKEFSFEAAHQLGHLHVEGLPPEQQHPCSRVHGHSYKVILCCSGDLIPYFSWVVDYADISKAVKPLIDRLDHQNLNDILNTHTTAENLAYWFWWNLNKALPSLVEVQIKETEKTNVIYRPPGHQI